MQERNSDLSKFNYLLIPLIKNLNKCDLNQGEGATWTTKLPIEMGESVQVRNQGAGSNGPGNHSPCSILA